MAALTDQADRWLNISRLELTVFADNRRAIALYERFGFEPEGVHRAHCFRDGVLVDTVTMARLRAQSQTPGDGLESAGFP